MTARYLKILSGVFLAWLFASSCLVAEPKPITPPNVPAELPIALRFPDGLDIDTATVGGVGDLPALTASPLLGPGKNSLIVDDLLNLTAGDDIKDLIAFTGRYAHGVFLILNDVLQTLNDLGDIPISPQVTRFSKLTVLEHRLLGPKSVEIKIDFTDFDDLDFHDQAGGGRIACSGCTCPFGCDENTCEEEFALSPDFQPICFRIWVQDTVSGAEPHRVLSGRFTEIPTAGDRGAGFLQGTFLTNAAFGQPESSFDDELFKVFYDQSAGSEDIFSDILARFFAGPGIPAVPVTEESSVFDTHVRVDRSGAEETAIKTIRFSNRGGTDLSTAAEQRIVGRWKEGQPFGEDFWSGSQDANSFLIGFPLPFGLAFLGTQHGDFNGACALISTGIVQGDISSCLELGIDATDEPFFDFLEPPLVPFTGSGEVTPEDVFPASFPGDPGF